MLRNRRNGDPNVDGEPHHMENAPLNRNAADNNRRLNAVPNIALNRAQGRAEEIADDPRRVNQVIVDAGARQDRLRAVASNLLMIDFFDMIDMVKHANAFQLRRGTKLLILGSLIYVASPLDLIPDIIPVIGYLDDIGILTLTVTQIKREISDFRRWRNVQHARNEREDQCPNCVIA